MVVPDFQSFMLPLLNFCLMEMNIARARLLMHSHIISPLRNPIEGRCFPAEGRPDSIIVSLGQCLT